MIRLQGVELQGFQRREVNGNTDKVDCQNKLFRLLTNDEHWVEVLHVCEYCPLVRIDGQEHARHDAGAGGK